MHEFEKIEKSLKTILKKGDLYDIVALKERKNLARNFFIRTNILFFSRILYGGVFLGDLIKNHLAPVNEIKEAQDTIRKTLEVSVDVICEKVDSYQKYSHFLQPFKQYLPQKEIFFLYQNEGIPKETYIKNLKKIHHFCELHGIKTVLLKESDFLEEKNIPFSDFSWITMENILHCSYQKYEAEEISKIFKNTNISYDINGAMASKYYKLSLQELNKVIIGLEKSIAMDVNTLYRLCELIENRIVENAILNLKKDLDLQKFKNIIIEQLKCAIEMNSTYKSKTYGKVYQSIQIKDNYVQVLEKNNKGEIVGKTILTLFDFLEVSIETNLMEKIKLSDENKEIYVLSAIYLHVLGKLKNRMSLPQKNFLTFYDYIFACYKEKEKNNISKIPGLYTRNDYIWKRSSMFWPLYYIFITIMHLKEPLSLKTDPTLLNRAVVFTINFYEESWEFEKQNVWNPIFSPLVDKLQNLYDVDFNLNYDFFDFKFAGKTGDTNIKNGNKKVIATVRPLTKQSAMPLYYAQTYAEEARYEEGELNYIIMADTIYPFFVEEATPILEIEMKDILSRNYIKETTSQKRFNFNRMLFPLGEDYVITNVKIKEKNGSKVFNWNKEREIKSEYLTDEEIEYLNSMESPIITYTYGINEKDKNTFINSRNFFSFSTDYTRNSFEEVKGVILEGLDLPADASKEEIHDAIKNKKYSKTPIKDAHLTHKIKKMDELEYFKTIASLDSLVCNLAATLAVTTEEDLTYTIGFLDNGDFSITLDEAHAWAMDEEGNIVDLTPTKASISTLLSQIFDFCILHHIPYYIIFLMLIYKLKEKYGKKITFCIKVKNIEKFLNSSDIDVVYAKVNEFLYGGINEPIKQNSLQYIKKIKNEFSSFSKEELQELKNELKANQNYSKKEQDKMKKFINEIPFVVENASDLQRKLEKK